MATTAKDSNRNLESRHPGSWLLCLLLAALGPAGGCTFNNWLVKKEAKSSDGAGDSLVLRGQGLEKVNGAVHLEMEEGQQLLRDGQHAKAERFFAGLANNTKNPVPVAEAARFYEGECQYLQGHYPRAEGTFKKLLQDFRHGQYQEKATKRLFDIAYYWLDDTRRYMEACEEKKEGKRWFVMPASYVHFEREKPLLDQEGRALLALEEVRLHDLNGPMGERALFYMATVKFFREDYRDADYYYSQVYENYPNGELAAKAIKQAIICKQICTGGHEYDGRMVIEARKLIDSAARGYVQMSKDHPWLEQQLSSIQQQQAASDYSIAEFYRRTGHPGSAYFYYELVRRRYPGTQYATRAQERMTALEKKLGKQPEGLVLPLPGPAGRPAESQPQPETAPPPRQLPPTFPGRSSSGQQPGTTPPRSLPPMLPGGDLSSEQLPERAAPADRPPTSTNPDSGPSLPGGPPGPGGM